MVERRVGGGDGAGDGGEVAGGFAEVLGYQVGGKAGGEPFLYAAEGVGAVAHGGEMALVGHYQFLFGVVLPRGGFAQHSFQRVASCPAFADIRISSVLFSLAWPKPHN